MSARWRSRSKGERDRERDSKRERERERKKTCPPNQTTMGASVLEGSPLSSARGSTHTFVQGSLPLNLHTCPAGHRVHPDQFWAPHWGPRTPSSRDPCR